MPSFGWAGAGAAAAVVDGPREHPVQITASVKAAIQQRICCAPCNFGPVRSGGRRTCLETLGGRVPRVNRCAAR
jgi:hypothetical protein